MQDAQDAELPPSGGTDPEAATPETPVAPAADSSAEVTDASATAALPIAEQAEAWLRDGLAWAEVNLLTAENLTAIGTQIGVIFAALFVGRLIAPRLRKAINFLIEKLPEQARPRVRELAPLVFDRGVQPAVWIGLLWIGQTVLAGSGMPHTLVRIAASLATAWLIIRLVTQFLPEGLRSPVTYLAWGGAVLSAFGVLDDAIDWLNSFGVPFGDGGFINAAFVMRAILMAAVFMFAASWLSKSLKSRVETLPRVEPSIRILLSNAIQIGLFLAAAILTLSSLGIPLTGLAVLGGAIGVGLGFGMQQIVANFISGVILLTDRSIKPNDVIEVDDTYGVVKSLGLRYASVITRDGKEHLIPNEMLITDKVVNWSYSDNKVRIKRRFIVEYETDLRLAVRLCVEAASATPRVLDDPAPKCLVMEFGDEAVEMEARFWIDDPQNGVNNIGSEVMLDMWDKFKEHGIDAPLQQEEIKITSDSLLKVQMVKDEPEKDVKKAIAQLTEEDGDAVS